MLNSVPVETVLTLNFIKNTICNYYPLIDFRTFLKNKKINNFYIHFNSLIDWLKNSTFNNRIACEIRDLWEENILRPIPKADELAELPAIYQLNENIYPDNVQVYCGTFGEYVELRKHFGKEDVKY